VERIRDNAARRWGQGPTHQIGLDADRLCGDLRTLRDGYGEQVRDGVRSKVDTFLRHDHQLLCTR